MEKPVVVRGKEIHTIRKNSFEKAYWAQQTYVCGIDEAGRGPLAGPVVAAAVIVPIGCSYRLLKDSKLLTEEERDCAYAWIIKNCWYGFSIEDHRAIDVYNIYRATLRAMGRAFCQLNSIASVPIGGVLVDAMPLTFMTDSYQKIPVHAFIYAESLSISVAAASIVAKVTRDRLMKKLNPALPGYFFDQHKGYATLEHRNMVQMLGKSIIHRDSFLAKLENNKEYVDEATLQGTLW